jgi:predicted small secreted protein
LLYGLQPLKPTEEKVIFVPNYLKKHIMKKLFALLFVAAAFTFTSCGDASGNASEEAATEEGMDDATEEEATEEAPAEEAPAATEEAAAEDAPAEEAAE